MRLRYFLFLLIRFSRAGQGRRVVGGVIIAGETPLYVGRLLAGSDAVENLSELVVRGQMTARLADDLLRIAAAPGATVERRLGEELFTLFDDPIMAESGTTVTFVREGEHLSFVRKTNRYEDFLREFVAEQTKGGCEGSGPQSLSRSERP